MNNNSTNIVSDQDVSKAWCEAGAHLGVRVVAPFEFVVDGRTHRCIAFLPHFSHTAGIVVAGHSAPDFLIDGLLARDAATLGYGVSFVNRRLYRRFDAELFMDTLREWAYMGPEDERPAWM